MLSFTLIDLLTKNVPERADHPALISGDTGVSYGELHRQVMAVAGWLCLHGIRRGDCIGIHLPKSVEEVVATLGAARIGAIFVNINYQWTIHQLSYIVQDCGIRTLITDQRRAQKLIASGIAENLECMVVCGRAPVDRKAVAWDALLSTPEPTANGPIDVDLAALLYTSGSTGRPKGVMLTHQNIVLGARSVACYLENTSQDRILSLPPLSFDYGLNQITTTLLVGGTVVLQSVPLPAEIVKTVVSKRVTGMALVAPSWVQVVQYLQEAPAEFPALRYLTNTGGKIPESVLAAMPEIFPRAEIYLMYGLTEAFRSTYLPPKLFREKMGSIGRAIPNAEIFVVDPEKGVCGPGEQGELIHRGSLISRGYWGDSGSTAEKIKVNRHLRSILGEEKVLHSGDIVRIDEDGYLWFVGRADSMIKCSGFRLSPTEVEELIYRYGNVTEVVAFGVEDAALGQVVHVAVSSGGGATAESEQLLCACRQNMPNYMVPRHVHCWEGLMPRTSSGKIDRQTVIRTCRDELLIRN